MWPPAPIPISYLCRENSGAPEPIGQVRLAAKYGKSLPQFALRWTLSNPVVGTALVGFRSSAEVTESLGALGWEISKDDMTEIGAILARHGAVTVPPGWLED